MYLINKSTRKHRYYGKINMVDIGLLISGILLTMSVLLIVQHCWSEHCSSGPNLLEKADRCFEVSFTQISVYMGD